ncbi:hypothetical protein F511_29733 [Dorcoceras hygrometricum]|uniref:Dystroglycan-like n=1 Tax=Dorcoceras hygrometricum TaxID=472368 RepID=A0A2Z7CME5_9LAMI|nr:hypothetical protein F511_29733 [Dorcoceras hygrometricum]
MASSLISNTVHILFASVLAMDDVGIVAIFEVLVASGLKGFLGCPAVIYEAALIEFFQHGSVRDGMVGSTIQGKTVEITDEVFAGTFELPMDGLTDLNEVPKDLVLDAKNIFSFTGEQVSTSCKKREMKIEFRLLSDILAKSIFVKVGSFDAVTHERILMMAAINGGVNINWSRVLFNIFKDMVTPGSKQARGYAVQICCLLKKVQDLELGDFKAFPPLKILTEKTVNRYIAINDKISVEDVDVGDNGGSGSRFPGAQRKRLAPTGFTGNLALQGLTNLVRTKSPRYTDRNKSDHTINDGGGTAARRWRRREGGAAER